MSKHTTVSGERGGAEFQCGSGSSARSTSKGQIRASEDDARRRILFVGRASGCTMRCDRQNRRLPASSFSAVASSSLGLARNAARPELLSRQIVLGRPLIFADFGGHDFPSFSERRPNRQLAVAALGSSPRGIGSLGRVSRAGNIVIFTTSRSAGARQKLRSIRGFKPELFRRIRAARQRSSIRHP
jgi:hypothetical protein